MKAFKIFFSVITSLLMAVFVGCGIGYAMDVNPLIPVGGLVVASFIPSHLAGVLPMAINKEVWVNHIIENLYRNNDFLNDAFNADQYVLAGKVVHIPQAAADPSVVKNRANLPAIVVKRADTDVTYAIDEYTSDPILIPNADKYELSYDKRESVLRGTESKIRQEVAEWMLRNWAPTAATSKVRTTGGAVAAHTSAGTGNRKKIISADFQAMQLLFDSWDIPEEDRFCMLDANMYNQLISGFSETTYRDFSRVVDAAKGVVGELFSFKVRKRSKALIYSVGLEPKDPDSDGATTDNAAALFWQKDCVERALGEVDFFEKLGDPTYYGDIYSMLVRMGGRIRRADSKGVAALIQDVHNG
jgi:hypothetical protein